MGPPINTALQATSKSRIFQEGGKEKVVALPTKWAALSIIAPAGSRWALRVLSMGCRLPGWGERDGAQ